MKIIGTGSALPEQIVTNEDLTKFLDTSDEWIVSHTGIRERRVLDRESVNDIGTLAAGAPWRTQGLPWRSWTCSSAATSLPTTLRPGPRASSRGRWASPGRRWT